MEIRILEKSCSPEKILEIIEENIKTSSLTREEIRKLKRQSANTKIIEIPEITKPKKEPIKKDSTSDADFEEEIKYYLEDLKSLEDDFTEDDLLSILPSRKTYRYKDILLRLIAESYKEIKDLNEIVLKDSFTEEDLKEIRRLILLEQRKIKLLKEHLKGKEEVISEEEIHNEIVLIPSKSGNIKLIEDLEHIHPSFYEDFLELIESIKNGSFKGVKRFTNNTHFAGICEVRGDKVRIVFTRINKNTYALITAFIKKCDNDKGYRDTLTLKLNDYRSLEPSIKSLIENEEFQKENELNLERLYNLLGKTDESSLKEVL